MPHPEQAPPHPLWRYRNAREWTGPISEASPATALDLAFDFLVCPCPLESLTIKGDNWPCPGCLLPPSIRLKKGNPESHSSPPLKMGKLRPLERLWIPISYFLAFWASGPSSLPPAWPISTPHPHSRAPVVKFQGCHCHGNNQFTRPFLWGFPQVPCPGRRQKGLLPLETRELGEGW